MKIISKSINETQDLAKKIELSLNSKNKEELEKAYHYSQQFTWERKN